MKKFDQKKKHPAFSSLAQPKSAFLKPSKSPLHFAAILCQPTLQQC